MKPDKNKRKIHFVEEFYFFQIYTETKNGNKVIRVKNNDHILTTDNWQKHKDVFFIQRMEKHKPSYTIDEKIKLELEDLETIQFNKRDNKVLADRYKVLLESKKNLQIEIDKSVVEPEYKSQILFNVGLLMASGKLDKYYTITKSGRSIKKGYSAPKIAKELQKDNYHKHILATLNDYKKENSNGNKNIFNSKDMMQKVIDHCNENNIKVIGYFSSHLPSE